LKPYREKNYENLNYGELTRFSDLVRQLVNSSFKIEFIHEVVKMYCDELAEIISKSPPLEHQITVYRGVKGDAWMKIDNDTKEFKTIDFWSTSIVLNKANDFSDQTSCCIHKLNLLPGSRGLVVFYASIPSYRSELEILLGPGNKFLLQRSGDLLDLPLGGKNMRSKTLLMYPPFNLNIKKSKRYGKKTRTMFPFPKK
jgi:hypothetical protein